MFAWAIIKKGKIPENNDDPRFLCVFKTKKTAESAVITGEKIIKVVISKYE